MFLWYQGAERLCHKHLLTTHTWLCFLCHPDIVVLLSADICQAIEPKVPFYKLGRVGGDLKPPTFKGSHVERVPCIKTSQAQEQRTGPSALP